MPSAFPCKDSNTPVTLGDHELHADIVASCSPPYFVHLLKKAELLLGLQAKVDDYCLEELYPNPSPPAETFMLTRSNPYIK